MKWKGKEKILIISISNNLWLMRCIYIMTGDEIMNSIKLRSTLFALVAALLYAINMPFSKLLLNKIEPVFMASFLYLGAGIGIGIIYFFTERIKSKRKKA